MADLVQIANLSLSRIGTRSTIADLDEDSPEARSFKTIYDHARDETLEAMDWGFARCRQYLADLGAPPVDWSYRYAYPADCLKMRGIYDPLDCGVIVTGPGRVGHTTPAGGSGVIPYEVAIDLDAQGNDLKVVYCDQPQAMAFYTKRITNTALFPAGFVSALSWACGAQMAVPLTGNLQLMQACESMWRQISATAAAADANEGVQQQTTIPDWIAHR
jgi:hypothetical protein